jgi:hypothetical protein
MISPVIDHECNTSVSRTRDRNFLPSSVSYASEEEDFAGAAATTGTGVAAGLELVSELGLPVEAPERL